MAQYFDNASKYVMLQHAQEFAEFMTGSSDIIVLIKQLLPEGIMQKSPLLQLYIQEAEQEALKRGLERGLEQGLEQGERKGTIENIIALLGPQFNTDAVHALKPALESIENLQDLRQLLLTVPQSESLEAFMQSLRR